MTLPNQCNIINIVHKILFLVVIILLSSSTIMCKCKIDDTKTIIECNGRLWKNELLPSKSATITELKIRNGYLSTKTLSQKRSQKLDLDFLKEFSNIKSITIAQSNLEYLPIVSFDITTVEYLDLSYNNLDIWSSDSHSKSGLFEQQSIIRHAIRLKTLDLSHNKLTTLPLSWLSCTSQLHKIILDYNMVTGLDPKLSNCLVNLRWLSLRGNYYRLATKTTFPSSPPRSRKLSPSPYSLLNKSPNSNQKSRFVKTRCIKQENLGHQHNYNGRLPSFLSVRYLDLTDNCIEHLGHKLPFMKFKSLTTLLLAHNLLSTPSYSPSPSSAGMNLISSSSSSSSSSDDTFIQKCDIGTAAFYIGNNQGLRHIDLSSNPGIDTVQRACLFGINHLHTLNLSNCSIIHIEKNSFKDKLSLVDLDLSHNQLKHVPTELNNLAITLNRLSLANNHLTAHDSLVLLQMTHLKQLNISGNNYRAISVSTRMTGVKQLVKSPTSSDKSLSLLHKMYHLEILDLSSNNITEFSLNSDLSNSQRMKLKYLDLSGNTGLEVVQFTQGSDGGGNDAFITLDTVKLPASSCCFKCNCASFGFIKWAASRPEKITLKCKSPSSFQGELISSQKIRQHLNNKCLKLTNRDNSPTYANDNNQLNSRKSPDSFSLVIQSNANKTKLSTDRNTEFQSPSHQSDSVSTGQNWILLHNTLILVCQSTMKTPITRIEWRRQKVMNSMSEPLVPFRDLGPQQEQQQHSNFAWNRADISLRARQSIKTELLGSIVDPRIKVVSYGPIPAQRTFNLNTLLNPKSNNHNGLNSKLLSQLEAAVLKQKPNNNPSLDQLKQVSILQLSNIQFSDAGDYYCLASSADSSSISGNSGPPSLVSNKINISIYSPPRFTVTPGRQISAIEGESVEIPCSAKAYPPPTTALGLAGTRSFPAAASRRLVVYKDDASFFITPAKSEDTGNYTCTSRNPAGMVSLHFTLQVQVPATILDRDTAAGDDNREPGERAVSVKVGNPLVLRFRVAGEPTPKVKWTKDAVLLLQGGRVRFSEDKLMLVVEKSQLSDAGLYKISVLNGFGSNHASVRVTVLNPGDAASSSDRKVRAPAWLGDYWLSGIVIVVLLSILLTSALWVVVFVCCTRRCILPPHRTSSNIHHRNWLRTCLCFPESDINQNGTKMEPPTHYVDIKGSEVTPSSLWRHQISSPSATSNPLVSDSAHQLLSELLLSNSYHSDHTTTTNFTLANDGSVAGGINNKKSSGSHRKKSAATQSKLKSSQSIPVSISQHTANLQSPQPFTSPQYHHHPSFNLFMTPSSHNHHSYSDISMMILPHQPPPPLTSCPTGTNQHQDNIPPAATPASLRFISSPSSSPSIYHPPPTSRLKAHTALATLLPTAASTTTAAMYDSGVESGSTLYTTAAPTTDSLHSVDPSLYTAS